MEYYVIAGDRELLWKMANFLPFNLSISFISRACVSGALPRRPRRMHSLVPCCMLSKSTLAISTRIIPLAVVLHLHHTVLTVQPSILASACFALSHVASGFHEKQSGCSSLMCRVFRKNRGTRCCDRTNRRFWNTTGCLPWRRANAPPSTKV